jgi:hypothetical protein
LVSHSEELNEKTPLISSLFEDFPSILQETKTISTDLDVYTERGLTASN